MGDILAFPTPAPKDGGKVRFLRRRKELELDDLALLYAPGIAAPVGVVALCDLTMGCADPEDTVPCEYQAPDQDYS
jgi:hypothetical protein